MLIKRLSSNLPGFHTIEFQKGVNFILGKRSNPISKNMKNSYNGVGKSLIIELIHFCLGSNSIKCFKDIGHYICELDIETNGTIHQLKRFFDGKQEMFLDDEMKTLTEIKEFLDSKCFFREKPEYVSARSIISRFVRRYKSNYSKYFEQITGEKKEISLVNNAYLLGLDTNCIIKKIKNKEKSTLLLATKKSLNSDEILVDYFKGKGNIDFKLKNLEDKKKALTEKIDSFNIVDNYSLLKKETDELSLLCNKLTNRITYLNYLIEKASIVSTTENIFVDVDEMYKDLNLNLPELVIKKIDEVNKFHKEIIKYRNLSYTRQKNKYIEEKNKLEKQFKNYKEQLLKKLLLLKDSGALEEYNQMCQELATINSDIDKTSDYKQLMLKYENEIHASKEEKNRITIENSNYLKSIQNIKNEIMDKFRFYSKKFYNNKASGLSIELNSKDNKIAFEINADIEGDSSDGINEVKIFSFDMTLLKLHRSNINFLVHDSRLLSNMDPRQKVIWFDILKEEFPDEGNDQYIVSINEDYLITMSEVDSSNEHKQMMQEFIASHTKITLTDENDKTKLLGFKVDIQYDK